MEEIIVHKRTFITMFAKDYLIKGIMDFLHVYIYMYIYNKYWTTYK